VVVRSLSGTSASKAEPGFGLIRRAASTSVPRQAVSAVEKKSMNERSSSMHG
jgi:hypothetical protein